MFSSVGSQGVRTISKKNVIIPPGSTLYSSGWSMGVSWTVKALFNLGSRGIYTTMNNGTAISGSTVDSYSPDGSLQLSLSGTSYPMIHGNYDISGNVYVSPLSNVTLTTYRDLLTINNPTVSLILPKDSGGMYITFIMPQYFKVTNPYHFLPVLPSSTDRTYILYGSNDGVTWTQLTNSITLNSTFNDSLSVPVLPNISVYKQFKWVFSNSITSTNVKFLNLIGDFYT